MSGGERIPRQAGGHLFGRAAASYERGRPPYPDALFQRLRERCGLRPGVRTLEIGAGAGLATVPLMAHGANPLVALEPDPILAERLRLALRATSGRSEVHVARFEEAPLPPERFDLVVAATAFHWVEPRAGLAKVMRVLRPGGWWAAWWHVFGDPERPDPFHEATQALLAELPDSPSHGREDAPPYALDDERRRAEWAAAGFEDVRYEAMHWTLSLDGRGVRALYGTFASINSLKPGERERLLDALEDVAVGEFGGRVERQMITALYTARKPVRR